MESLSKLSPHCPRWDELPRLALYMDQVCIAVGDALGPFLPCQEYALTATMVNNYVKQRLITPPEKKKYSPLHVSRLIMITLFKRVLSLGEIAALLDDLFASRDPQAGYDLFCQALEVTIQGQSCPAGCPPLLAAALRSLAGKLEFERLLPAPPQ